MKQVTVDEAEQCSSDVIDEEEEMESERRFVKKEDAFDKTDVASETHDKPSEAFVLNSVTLDETHQCLSDVMVEVEKMESERRDELPEEALEEIKLVTHSKTDQTLPDIIDEEENMESERYDESSEDVDITKNEAFEIKSGSRDKTDILDEDENMESEGLREPHEDVDETKEQEEMMKSDSSKEELSSESSTAMSENQTIDDREKPFSSQPVITNVMTLAISPDDKKEEQVSLDNFDITEDGSEIQIDFEAFPVNPTIKMEPTSGDEMENEFPPEDVFEDEGKAVTEFDGSEEIIVNVSPDGVITGEKLCWETVNLFRVSRNKNTIEMPQHRVLRSSSGAPTKSYKLDDSETDEDEENERMGFKKECVRRRSIISLPRFDILPSGFAPPKYYTENVTDAEDHVIQVSPESVFMCQKLDRPIGKGAEVCVRKLVTLQTLKNRRANNTATYSRCEFDPATCSWRKTDSTNNSWCESIKAAIIKRQRTAYITQIKLIRPENLSKHQRIARIKANAAKRLRKLRANEMPEQREIRRLHRAEMYRNQIANETPEQRTKRIEAKSEWKKRVKERVTLRHCKMRLASAADCQTREKDRRKETPEERQERLISLQAVISRKKRAKYELEIQRKLRVMENPEQREKRRLRVIEKYKIVLARETPEKREQRHLKMAEMFRRNRENERWEQRAKQLMVATQRFRDKISRQTLEERVNAAIEKYENKVLITQIQRVERKPRTYETDQRAKRLVQLKEKTPKRLVAATQRIRDNVAGQTLEQRVDAAIERYENQVVITPVQRVQSWPHTYAAERRAKRLAELKEETAEQRKQRLSSAGERMKQILAKRRGTPEQREKRLAATAKRMENKKVNEMQEKQCLATEMTMCEETNATSKKVHNILVTATETNKEVSEMVKQQPQAATNVNRKVMPEQIKNSVAVKINKEADESLKQQKLLWAAGERMKQVLAKKRKGMPKLSGKQLATLAKGMETKTVGETLQQPEKHLCETERRVKRGAALAAVEKIKHFQEQLSETRTEEEGFSDCYRVFGIENGISNGRDN